MPAVVSAGGHPACAEQAPRPGRGMAYTTCKPATFLTKMTSHVVSHRSVSQMCFSSSMVDHQSCAPGWQACLDHTQASAQLCPCFTGWSVP